MCHWDRCQQVTNSGCLFDLGWRLLSQFPPFRYFPNFSSLLKQTVKYRIYIWLVSPQVSCGDTCQIWMWFDESNMYFCETENFAYGEINEPSLSTPHPWPVVRCVWCKPVQIRTPLTDSRWQSTFAAMVLSLNLKLVLILIDHNARLSLFAGPLSCAGILNKKSVFIWCTTTIVSSLISFLIHRWFDIFPNIPK